MTLEERIDRIIHASEIELAGEAYRGKYELGNRKSITKFILDKLRKVYTNIATGDKITLSHSSAEKLATHSGEAYQKTIAHIPQIIENMQFLEKLPPDNKLGKKASFDNYSYYITPANIDGKPHTILSTVGYKNKEIYYDQNVFEGTPKQVFVKAETIKNNSKYDRLAEILQKKKKDSRDTTGIIPPEATAIQEASASANKYTKNSPNSGKNFTFLNFFSLFRIFFPFFYV